ncbi:MAG: carboxypeptidase-like regulatory domain-containing protein [Thermoanaerobaculum sp.]|nr:carboxypeptidase-like regulatory domain-containing protein [Thermoanaerobaculum sp.]
MSCVVTASPHPRLRLAASLSRTDLYDLQWELGGRRRWVWRTTWETGGPGSDRLTTTVGNRPAFWGDLSWRVGVSRSGPQVGPYLEASLRLLGGFWLRAEYAGVPTRAMAGQGQRPRLFVGLTADYAYSSGLLTPTGSLPLQRETGAIAGRLWVAHGRANLAGARVVVWGVGGTTTDSGGRFFLGSVPPGVYEVELDPDKLPLELVPKRSRVVVEVQAGVTTRVDFPMEVLVGVAGRVTDAAGRPVAGVRVVLEGEQSIRVKETSSDEFGLFRFDQVPLGTYILRAVGPEERSLTWRQVELREFLFDQDLQLPPLS